MRNSLTSYAKLEASIKRVFNSWLKEDNQEVIVFPYQGKPTYGYLFNYEGVNYLVAMSTKNISAIEADSFDDSDSDSDSFDDDNDTMDLDYEEDDDNNEAA